MTKPELRSTIRLRLRAIAPEARAARSAALCREIAASAEWAAARVVALFAPLFEEPDVGLLWAVALGPRAVCYPRVQGENLVFLRVAEPEALLRSRWNLLEPPHREEAVVPPGAIDLLLVPGVAFTREGGRMGRGGGYYDRLLADPALRAASFGVCFAEQIVPRLPTEAHDRPVSRVFSA